MKAMGQIRPFCGFNQAVLPSSLDPYKMEEVMKQILMFAFFCVFTPNNSFALEKEKPATSKYRLRSDIWPHLIVQPLYMFLELNIHEGSHVLAAKLYGYEIFSYKPYPHFVYQNNERNFVFGATEIQGNITGEELAVIVATPLITDVTLFISSDILLSNLNSDSRAAPVFFFAGMVWPWLDFVVSINASAEGSDTAIWAKETGIGRPLAIILGDSLAALGLWRVIHHGKHALFTVNRKEKRQSLYIVPGGGGIALGASF
jgi:hypothetical protein